MNPQDLSPAAGQLRDQSVARPIKARNLLISRAGRNLLNIDFIELGQSGCTVIVGPNGAGKSLLVRTLCHLQLPDGGDVVWAGKAPDRSRRHRIGLLLQRPVLLQRSAESNLMYVLCKTGKDRKTSKTMAAAALEAAGLSAVARVQANQLSGGEQQRLALTRALLLNPEVLFLDEPTANVDPASTRVIEQQLKMAIGQGLSVVMVSHDIGQVKRIADAVVLMHNGRLIEQSEKEHFFKQSTNPLSRRWLAGELLV